MGAKETLNKVIPKSIHQRLVRSYHDIDYRRRQKKADKYMKALVRKKSKPGLIKVGFIVQMPEIWGKQEPIFNIMREEGAFDPWLIIVPSYDFKNSRITGYGNEKEFFIQKSKGNYLLAWENGKWRDIQNDEFDYMFYQRPYDHYLPKKLRSDYVFEFSRICYVPYATQEVRSDAIYPYVFFRNIYFGFMEDEVSAEYNNRRFHDKFCSRFVNIGYPSFQICLSLDSRCDYQNVLWAPRWSYDSINGGSHFFEYVDELTTYDWRRANLKVRPHPLMWSNFLKEKRIDEDRICRIHDKWNKAGITVDDNKEIELTFNNTDILISDRSSIIPMFFLTGKPIIYCEIETDYAPMFSDILPGLYVANSWHELEGYLSDLLNGHDPKEMLRKEIIQKKFMHHRNASRNIVKYIYNDANNIGLI